MIRTTRPSDDSDFPARRSLLADPHIVQQLLYTYDAFGNITEVNDQAFEPVFFQNQQVVALNRYEYDALYRLTFGSGRENRASVGVPTNIDGVPVSAGFPIASGDPNALRNYTEAYQYDSAGNIRELQHQADSGNWTRDYSYALDDPTQTASNRLWQIWTGNNQANATTYSHDTHGNLLNLASTDPRFNMAWDPRDMIASLFLGGGGVAYYQYGAGKQRTRKQIVRNGASVEERIYLGGYELYRRTSGNGAPVEEIESHHLFLGEERILLVDDVLTPADAAHPRPDGLHVKGQTLLRYQYSNHLGSAGLELDGAAAIISYEEFHPYGTSAYRAVTSGLEVPPKRYRYTGMERDEESGLSYHSARYYASWLGRWVSVDPGDGGSNLYLYSGANPSGGRDRNGMKDERPTENSAYYARMADWFFKQGFVEEGRQYQEKSHSAAFAEGMAVKQQSAREGERVVAATWGAMGATIVAGVAAGVAATALAATETGIAVTAAVDNAVSAAGAFLRPRIAALALRASEAELLGPGGYATSATGSQAAVTLVQGAAPAATTLVTSGALASGTAVSATSVPAAIGVVSAVTAIGTSVAVGLNPDPLGLNQPPAPEPILENSRTRASRGLKQSDLKALAQRFRTLLPADVRAKFDRNETVAIAVVQEDGDQHLWYAVAQNRTSPAIRAAAEALGLERVTATPRAEGRGDVGAPTDAEQLLLEAADENDVKLMGQPEATRPYCRDCACAVNCH